MEAPNANQADPGSHASPPEPEPPPPVLGFRWASDRLGAWNYYFIAKLLLVWRELIGFHPIENLAFVAVLAGPLTFPRWRRFRHWLAVPVAVALLYHESWLPRFSRVVSQAGLVSGFSADYLAELAGRFISGPVVAMLAVALVLCFATSRFLRLDVFVVAALLTMALFQATRGPKADIAVSAAGAGRSEAARSPDAILQEFYGKEAQRTVFFRKPPEGSAPFDLVFVHVCSLSWDDLEATGMAQHPFLKSFDIVLGQFNSVSTYSGPAAIRILRAGCGQTPHRDLYSPAPERCYLMPGLEGAGFETQLVLDHDGHFDDFLAFVKQQGVKAAPMSLEGISAPQRSFDGSRIYDDQAVLSRWLDNRQKTAAPRVATFYNSVSLHDGNRMAGDAQKGSLGTYGARLATLLDGLQTFTKGLEKSGRRTVVVLVPEHGGAVRGDAMQIAGLREIPTPAITLVPVGIRVIGPDARRLGDPLRSDEPTSYLALSHVISRMLEKPPFGAGGFRPADYAEGMPTTNFVSENEAATLLKREGKYLLRQDREPWKEYRGSPRP